jgi:microcystin-dependent protein
MKRLLATAALASALQVICAGLVSAEDMYLGEIRLFGYNWCPVGWAPAAGQTLLINQNTRLFSLYGTAFGGNGVTTFGLPNLNGGAADGGSAAVPNPALTLKWCVAITGIYPSRP